jgi:hypothetical protein
VTGVAGERSHRIGSIRILWINALPQVFRGLETTVAIQAPPHGQRLSLGDAIHLFHVSMTGLTGNALGDVAFVIEMNMIRELMNPNPLNGLPFRIGFLDLLHPWTFRVNHRVAIHTSGHRRHGRMGGLVSPGVAVAAINLESARVKLVAERNGLLGSVSLV